MYPVLSVEQVINTERDLPISVGPVRARAQHAPTRCSQRIDAWIANIAGAQPILASSGDKPGLEVPLLSGRIVQHESTIERRYAIGRFCFVANTLFAIRVIEYGT